MRTATQVLPGEQDQGRARQVTGGNTTAIVEMSMQQVCNITNILSLRLRCMRMKYGQIHQLYLCTFYKKENS